MSQDSFFVSASLLKRPEHADKPVAVCHARGAGGQSVASTSEVASVNYAARAFGLKVCRWSVYLGF